MDIDMKENSVIQGHQMCQTEDASWLCLDNIYMKFHRPNIYDIGGTNIDHIADYWFLMQTEQVGKVFLLHIFIMNRHESTFTVSISANNELTFNKRHNFAHLTTNLEKYSFKNVDEMVQNYLTTYSFTSIDVESLRNYKLYIPISFDHFDQDNSSIDSNMPFHDFETLLKDPVGADFTIESADGEKFKVHRILLTSLCEVFKAMLKEDTAESQNGFVKLVDVSKEDLSCIVEFIYTGTVKDIENNNFFSLLMLADRYDLKGLKELAEIVLSNQLSSENVLEILAVADLYNSQHLKTASMKFLKQNPTAIHSSMFSELKNVELVQELCKFMIPQ
ncbi:BTB/POZ and MATH domain-containing protein 5-like [Aricia agestis]|uniref:BTB/POZ and MATH domain-containing protein 5-like n=1 Tax=Aricia agestis TaxID=91739 RepID=UPI001C201782|nr:BTB/POZ and MATH domain-containing protein 5-like [Aricia agestis]